MSSESVNRSVSAGQASTSVYQSLLGLYDPHVDLEEKREILGRLPGNMGQRILFWIRSSGGNPSDPSNDGNHDYLLHSSLPQLQQAVQKVTSELFESLSKIEKDAVKRQQQKLQKYVDSMQTEEGRIGNLVGSLSRKIAANEGCRLREKWIALHTERGLIREDKVISAIPFTPEERKPVDLIAKLVAECCPEHQLHVCAILYAKFECSREEKEAVADILYDFDGTDVSDLTDKEIPKYAEAPEAEQKAADEFLVYASGCVSHQTIQFRLALKPEAPEIAPGELPPSQEELRQTSELFQVNLGHLISLCRGVDPVAKSSILLLESMHDWMGDVTPELQQILDIWTQEGGPDEDRSEARDRMIRFLKNVDEYSIDLEGLNLRSLPPIFDRYSFVLRLEELSLAGNHLTTLPEQFSALNNLRLLNLGQNQLTVFPKQLTSLENLEWLNLGHNELKSSAFKSLETSRLKSLTILDLEHNELTTCPSQIINHLKELKILKLGHNQIRIIPAQIFRLRNLKTLDISYNKLIELPRQLGELKKLEQFSLQQNPTLKKWEGSLQLPKSCTVSVWGTGQVEGDIKQVCSSPGYQGPQVKFDY